jgi:hypothetical protein
MKKKKRISYAQHSQFPNLGIFSSPLYPSYMTIGGSGIVGNYGAESPMSELHETPSQEANEGASMNSGAGEAAGAGITGSGSGVA